MSTIMAWLRRVMGWTDPIVSERIEQLARLRANMREMG